MGGAIARRLAAIGAAGVAVAFGVGVMSGGSHALAQGIPSKTCVDPSTSSGTAQPGDSIICTVDINGALLNGSSYTVSPTAPAGAEITGCAGATGGTAPDNYTSMAQGNKLKTTASSCTWSISSTLPLTFNGQNQIGTESLLIPAETALGTSVTQQAQECVQSQCGPFTPMGVSGPGSCVGGTALPVLGGCVPALPGTSPSPSASPSSSPTPVAQTSPTPAPTAGVQAAATTPFTGGPTHPFPSAGAAIAAGGLAAGLAAIFGPSLLRRMRRLPVRRSGPRA